MEPNGTKEIRLFQFEEEKLRLDYACETCQCFDLEKNATECSTHGTLECGACQCNKGWKGIFARKKSLHFVYFFVTE